MLKTWAIRTALVLIGWLLSGFVAMIPLLIASKETLDNNYTLYQKADTGYILFCIWTTYRLGARGFRLSPPTGYMKATIDLMWVLWSYVIVGGSVELAVGHPTIAAGLSGLPLAVVLYILLKRQGKAKHE